MRLLKKLDFPDMNFSLYFLGYTKASSIPTDEVERTRWTFSQPATLELTHNWGTELQEGASPYHNVVSVSKSVRPQTVSVSTVVVGISGALGSA